MALFLNDLINGAIQLAGGNLTSHNARLWQSDGGRSCPLGWSDCSQAVYVDIKTGEYDYGEPGGPGNADCARYCKHGRLPPRPDDDDEQTAGNSFRPYNPADALATAVSLVTDIREKRRVFDTIEPPKGGD